MPFTTATIDGAQLHYIDYVPASSPTAFQSEGMKDVNNLTLIFIHGWPMSSLMYDHLMLPLCETHRLRCIAIDRRGFGKSEWNGSGQSATITYETFANDTLDILESLELNDFIFVASSMGCGENVLSFNCMGEALKNKCKGMIWLGPSMPYPLRTVDNPLAPPRELWDAILSGLRNDRAGFAKASLPGVFGVPVGIPVDEGALQRFEFIVQQADALAMERCIQIITEKDFTKDLKELGEHVGLQMLIVHGDSDQGESKVCESEAQS